MENFLWGDVCEKLEGGSLYNASPVHVIASSVVGVREVWNQRGGRLIFQMLLYRSRRCILQEILLPIPKDEGEAAS